MRIAVVQTRPRLGDVETNLAMHREALVHAREAGASLVVFPELSLTGNLLLDLVPWCARSAHGVAQALNDAVRGLDAVVGFVDDHKVHYHNAALYLSDGQMVHVHHKTFGTPGMSRFFAAGHEAGVFKTRFGRTAILLGDEVLEDVAVDAVAGADLVLIPAAQPAWGITPRGKEPYAVTRFHERVRHVALRLAAFVVLAHRVGQEDGYIFWGPSAVYGPDGRVVVQAEPLEPTMLLVDINLDEVSRARGRFTPASRPQHPQTAAA